MNDTIAGAGVITLAVMYLPTLIAVFGARRFLPFLGVGTLNTISVLLALPAFLLAVLCWFAALFIAISASNRTRRDVQHKELIRAVKQQAVTPQKIEPPMYEGPPRMGQSSWWPQPQKRD
ncbi:hypothetical protein [Bosea sp. BK604]|uniref:hypothetical protein n=1 Tax=Bosea sp. BK604 TaxID=2512180 RepID=UPI001051DB9A|nr:hypothetical protein [Bosea sp. BK604]TCR60935.1 hypothetical protein EV560_115160 [Bosea sp. BK604]